VAFVTYIATEAPFSGSGERFIGHGDAADLAIVARNMAEGKGPVVDCVWLLHAGGIPGNRVTQPEPYWSIYAAAVMAVFFQFMGPTKLAVDTAAYCVHIAVAGLSGALVYRFCRSVLAALLCATLLLTDYSMLSQVNGLSDIYVTFCILAAISTMVLAIRRESGFSWLLCGVFSGLALGMKPTGLLLVGLVPCCVAVSKHRFPALRCSWSFPIGFALSIAPLLAHNLTSYGSLCSPALPLVFSANDTYLNALNRGTYRDPVPGNNNLNEWGTAVNSAFYDPSTPPARVHYLSWEWNVKAIKRVRRLVEGVISGEVLPIWLLPFGFYACVTSVYFNCRRDTSWWTFLTALVLAGGAALLLGTRVMFQARYFNFLVPLVTIAAITSCTRLSRVFLAFGFGIVGLTAINTVGVPFLKGHRPPLVPPEYAIAKTLLPESAIVMTQNPWEFSFHTRHPSVMLPFTDRDDVLLTVARRYDASHLVILNRDARHPRFDLLEENGEFPAYLEKVHYSANLLVGKFAFPRKTTPPP
jgi:hypothetical protein